MPLNTDEIPTKINEFFSRIGPKLAEDLPDIDVDLHEHFHGDIFQHENFEISITNVDTVIKYVKEISVYKSSGISDLGSRLLKDVFLYIPEILVSIFNKVIRTGIFPDS